MCIVPEQPGPSDDQMMGPEVQPSTFIFAFMRDALVELKLQRQQQDIIIIIIIISHLASQQNCTQQL